MRGKKTLIDFDKNVANTLIQIAVSFFFSLVETYPLSPTGTTALRKDLWGRFYLFFMKK